MSGNKSIFSQIKIQNEIYRDRLSLNLESKCSLNNGNLKKSDSVESSSERSPCFKEEIAYEPSNLVSYKCAAAGVLKGTDYSGDLIIVFCYYF